MEIEKFEIIIMGKNKNKKQKKKTKKNTKTKQKQKKTKIIWLGWCRQSSVWVGS